MLLLALRFLATTVFLTTPVFAAPILIGTTTSNGTVPGTAITYTISSNGSARAVFSPGSTTNNTWSWYNSFPEFLAPGAVGDETLTVTFSAPVPINLLVLGLNSFSVISDTERAVLTLGGGTAATSDFNVSDGLAVFGNTGPLTYNGATGVFTPTGTDQALMIGSTSTTTITSFSLAATNGPHLDGYTLFFGTVMETPEPGTWAFCCVGLAIVGRKLVSSRQQR
jgi:hypothetical protein